MRRDELQRQSLEAALGEVGLARVEFDEAFAAITAERLIRLDPQRLPFTRSLRPLLDLVWRGALGDSDVFKPIAVALGQIYISDYWHNDGPEGPTDVDDDPAAAILYAAECYMWGLPAFAGLVADRATAAADYWVQLAPGRGDADCDAAVVTEAQRQLATLDGLAPLARWLPQVAGWAAPERESLLLQLEALIAVPRLDSTSTPAANED